MWARCGCCYANQGKEEWGEAIRLYEALYRDSEDSGGKLDALRRIAD